MYVRDGNKAIPVWFDLVFISTINKRHKFASVMDVSQSNTINKKEYILNEKVQSKNNKE